MAVTLQAQDAMERLEFEVDGMSCAGCERIIEGEVGDLAFVDDVSADAGDGSVVCTADETTRDSIQGTIESLGYQVN